MNQELAILILFGPTVLWLALTCLMLVYLFRRFWLCIGKKPGAKWNFRTIVFTIIAFVWIAGSFWYGGGIKLYYNAKVDRLCAIDGGVKVYEMVTLPPEKFDKWGHPNFFYPTRKENALGPEYIFKWEITDLRKGNPSLTRQHHEVIRQADGKLLGETTLYSRGGGDLPLPGQPSSYTCPPIPEAGNNVLLKQIFINSTR